MSTITTGSLGYGRMGPNRELKFALEKYWRGSISATELLKVAQNVEGQAWEIQKDLDKVTVGDFALYDNVLTWTEWLGIIPVRHQKMESGMDRMFAMARGVPGATALSMKKWLTSNYHYMVPEVDDFFSPLSPNFSIYLESVKRGISILGVGKASPVVMGPVSLAFFCNFKTNSKVVEKQISGCNREPLIYKCLCQLSDTRTENKINWPYCSDLVDQLIPIYKNLLQDLKKLGVKEIQVHEPALVFENVGLLPLLQKAYPEILPGNVDINLVSFFEDVGEENYKWMTSVKEFNVLSLDFTRGDSLELIEKFGFPKDKALGAGVIDGRSVWKMDPKATFPLLQKLISLGMKELRVQPSSSLQYVPWDLSCETAILGHVAGEVLAFSKQKVQEVKELSKAMGGNSKILFSYEVSWDKYRTALAGDQSVTNRINALTEKDFCRPEPYKVRRPKQLPGLPILPTTTIGSFPQTREIRSLRNKLKKGLITEQEYNNAIDQQIAFAIGVQEGLGLDILVHGESERTDMVEFFAKHMEGMLFTQNGWVQSFGSRCARPPIFWNDISRPKPMSTREYVVAQKLTDKPVKGMLTGPITVLNWSFPRVDIDRKTQAYQIALGISNEIADLEKAGCGVIQVDEPALREGMPLRANKKKEYLDWAVDAFRLSTAIAKPETQIHTHMCYCEFADCMDAIDKMDTDVISIENARSDDATLRAFRSIGYGKGLGPGTYDIHSPVVPPTDLIEEKITMFLNNMDKDELVINPDCGLKTRTWKECIDALKNMVEARDAIVKKMIM